VTVFTNCKIKKNVDVVSRAEVSPPGLNLQYGPLEKFHGASRLKNPRPKAMTFSKKTSFFAPKKKERFLLNIEEN